VASKYDLEIAVLIYNTATKKVLLKQENGTFALIQPRIPLDPVLSGDQFPSQVTKSLSEIIGISLTYVSVLDATIASRVLRLSLLLTTNTTPRSMQSEDINAEWLDSDELSRNNSTEYTHKLVHEGVTICTRHAIARALSSLKTVDDKAISFLNKKVVKKENLVGWPHYLGKESPGIIGTSMGVLCYLHAGVYSPIVSDAIRTVKAFQNEDGGWAVSTLIGRSSISVTESTCYALWALTEAGYGPEDKSVVKAVQWLEQNQRQSGGWASSSWAKRERVFPTAFAVRVLSKIEPSCNAVKLGVSWLQSAKNPDGGWGSLPMEGHVPSKTTAVHTAHVILALMSAGGPIDSEAIQNGAKWILADYSNATEDGWEDESEVEFVDVDNALDYRHYSAPWCVVALTRSGTPFFSEVILKACNALISKQHSLGYWTNRLVPGQIPIWATQDCLYALNEVVSNATTHLEWITQTVNAEYESTTIRRVLLSTFDAIMDKTRVHSPTNLKWMIIWNSLITLTLLLLVFLNPIFNSFIASASLIDKIVTLLAPILLAFLAGFAPFVYQIVLEEYKLRRKSA
jgi:squalene cyclase